MKRSHWFTSETLTTDGTSVEHCLLSFAKHIPKEHEDSRLAEKIGELDPFVHAAERGDDILSERVDWVLGQEEKEMVG